MIPMPAYALALQGQYQDMMSKVQDISEPINIPPAACLMLGFVGDHELNASTIKARRYFIGTNIAYIMNMMIERGFVIAVNNEEDRRKKYLKLTTSGLEIARQVRERLAKASVGIAA